MKKYIFIDIDGTLTNSKKQVTLETINAINNIEKEDFEVVFCSGRANEYLIRLAEKCQTSRYIISSNGSLIYDNLDKKIIYQNKIPFILLEKVYDYCKLNHIALSFTTEKNRYCNSFYNHDKNNQNTNIKKIRSIKDMQSKNITQIILGSYSYDEMTEIKNFLKTISMLEIVNLSTTLKLKQKESENGFFYDVVLKDVNKGSGIKNFIKIKKTNKENCIAIGDHVNDIDMFKAVGYKIAMGNAWSKLKENADFITKTNDEDGIVYALDRIKKEFL